MVKCKRCKGSGEEPEREMNDAQRSIVDQFIELGEERRQVRSARNLAGTRARERVYAKIRATVPAASLIGVPKVVIAEALGVSRTQLDSILNRAAS